MYNFAGLLGVLNDGAFAEYFVAPTENLFVLPNQVSFEVGGGYRIVPQLLLSIQLERQNWEDINSDIKSLRSQCCCY